MSAVHTLTDERERERRLIRTLEIEFAQRYRALMATAKSLENARRPTLVIGVPEKLDPKKLSDAMPRYYQALVNEPGP